jgi:hypothetical protein
VSACAADRPGELFADEWLATSLASGPMYEVFEQTGLIKWPSGGMFDPRQARYQDIENEILQRVFASVRPAVAEAFVKIAREVLARERRRR